MFIYASAKKNGSLMLHCDYTDKQIREYRKSKEKNWNYKIENFCEIVILFKSGPDKVVWPNKTCRKSLDTVSMREFYILNFSLPAVNLALDLLVFKMVPNQFILKESVVLLDRAAN